jgi:hypothetical protein
MNRRSLCLLLLLSAIYYASYSQINDSFSDGDFTQDPLWLGDQDKFIINEIGQLQLNGANTAEVAYLATPSESVSNAAWSFFIKMEFNPSSNNYMDVYLVSDQIDLKGLLNGYFVRIGNTTDEISLYRQTGEKSSSTKIIDGLDDRVDQSLVEMRIKVTRDGSNVWELLVDQDLSQQFISEGSVTDAEHYFSRYFGIVCNYTSTRSDKFYFDELSISGDAYTDTSAPEVDSIIVRSDSSIQVYFNEKMLHAGLINTDNYFVDQGIGNPLEAKIHSDSSIVLFFNQKFDDGSSNQISIHNLPDLFGNTIDNLVLNFSYIAPYTIGFGDIIITEIMADPTPGVDLPEYEYIEIHNPHPETFSLDNVKLIVGKDTASVPDMTVAQGEYVILCQHAAVDHLTPYGKTVKVPNWPSLNNRGESIILTNTDNEVVYTVYYHDSWYGSIDKDDGGFSLEMIDQSKPCLGSENWMASSDPNGGTPGKQNAVQDEIVDVSPPKIEQIIATSSHTLTIFLSEAIGPQKVGVQDITLNPSLEIIKAELQSPGFSNLVIEFQDVIMPRVVYELTLKNLADCIGNMQKETSETFVLPEAADSLDLIINEILFNPRPDGVDFVEIYNQSEKFIDLASISLGNEGMKPITSDHAMIKPGQFIAITENALTLQNQYPGLDMMNILETLNMPAFNNDQGNVYLANNAGTYLDFFHYEEDFHSKFLNDPEGVSLERISYKSASDDPANWQSAAASSGYATPGAINSQYIPGNIKEEEISVEPKVFVPGSNSYHSFATIKCRFPTSGNMANILILDPTGKTVRNILSHKSIGSEDNFKWEGLDDHGRQVRMGPYIVHVEIYNLNGTRRLYRKKVVVGGQL